VREKIENARRFFYFYFFARDVSRAARQLAERLEEAMSIDAFSV